MSTLLAFLLAASSQATDKEIPHPRTGEFKDEYKDPKTKQLVMRYRMRAPDKLPEKRHLGLIVYFHGMNGNEDSLFGFVTESLKRLGLTQQYVVMGGKARGAGWTKGDDEYLLKWIDWAKKTYPVDPRRVHIVGGSNGGWMVKRFGYNNQDLLASVSAYCGGGNNFEDEPTDPKLPPKPPLMFKAPDRTEFYLVHGDADKEVDVKSSRDCSAELKRKGYRYVYREITGGDHGSIFRVPDVADDVFAWMHSLRHKELPLASDDKKTLIAFKSKEEKLYTPEGIAEISRIGGILGGRAADGGFDVKTEATRVASVATTHKTLYGREMVIELLKLLNDKSDAVKEAAYRGLGVAANWRYPEAQEQVILKARSKATPVADRARAIEAMGKAAKLQLLGNFEDKMLIWMLVLLLDDEELKVREAAFAQLEKNVKDTFDYKPDLPTSERKASMAKWKSWCQTKCGPLDGRSAKSP